MASQRAGLEQAIFRLLLDDETVADADLVPRHFTDPQARHLWGVAQRMREDGADVTGFSLVAAGGDDDVQRDVLRLFVRDCRTSLAARCDLDSIVDGIRREADTDEVLRIVIAAGDRTAQRTDDPESLVRDLCAQLAGAVSRSRHTALPLSGLVRCELDSIVESLTAKERGIVIQTRISTGLVSLDAKIGGGLGRGSWTVIGARPGGCKTSVLMQFARSAPVPVVVFLYEDLRDLACRELAVATNIVATDIAGHRFESGLQVAACSNAQRAMRDDVFVVDARGMDARDIAREVRFYVEEHGVELAVVDYLNRMRHERADRYDLAIRGTMDVLDDMVGEHDIAGALGAQLSRAVVKESRLPRMDDLRDSGSVEEICKLGIVLHRPYQGRAQSEGGDSELWFVIDKQNIGTRSAIVKCGWDGPSMTISDMPGYAEGYTGGS